MKKSVWLDMDDAIQKQLALQVSLSLARHHAFMVKHGLLQCRSVVDVGTGSGRFLSEVASRHPAITFHGIDNKPHMIDAANAQTFPDINWVQAEALDSRTAALLRMADGILMRYFVLHLPDTAASFKTMLANVRPGTRLWILDVDPDHCRCEPPNAAFDMFVGLVRKYCDHNAVEIRTTALLPPILRACGFDVDDMVVEPFNNREIDAKLFVEYLMREASLYHYILHGTPGSDELRPLQDFLERRAGDRSQLMQYGMVMLSAVKRLF